MYRNSYNTLTGFPTSQPQQSHYRYTSTSGFGHSHAQRTPLYPIGPTLTQPQFKPMQRGISPSPYLGREGMKPPSYQNRYLQKADQFASQSNLTYEERQKRLIDRNQKQIQQEQKRRQQIRMSYERQIKALTAKLNRNLQKKQKLHGQIQSLQNSHAEVNKKLGSLRPPQKKSDSFEHIDRKQQQMIILKNKLMSSMRQNQIQLNAKQEQQQKYWQEQITQKQKILFQLQQNLRDKRLQLHVQKQKSLQKPDFLSIQQQVRSSKYSQFLLQYEDLQRTIKNLNDNRQRINKQIRDTIQLKKPQFHNANVRREELKRDFTNLQLRVEQLQRVSQEMDAANKNLFKQLQRKDSMITKYQSDIYELKQKKQEVQADINQLLNTARERDSSKLSKSMTDIFTKLQDDIRKQQTKGARLKNAYQKLYELLCSAVSKDIHQVFNQSVVA